MTFINILIAVSCMVILVAVLVRVIGYSVPVEGTNDNSKFFLPNATKPVIQDKKPPPSLNIIWRGGWRDDVSYEPYDGVSMDGSFYVAVTVSKNSPPPSGDWVVHLNSLDDKKMHDEIQRITKIMDTHRQLAPRLITGKSVVKLYYQENVHKCGVSQTWHGWNKHVFEFKNELISDVRVKVTLVCAPEKLFTMEFTALALTTENNSIGHTHLELRGKQCQLMTEVEALDTVDPDDFFALPPITVTC